MYRHKMCLEGQRKRTKTLIPGSLGQGWNSNRAPPECIRAVQWETGKVVLKSLVQPMLLRVGNAKAVTLS
jgi:hypothetical protein